MPRRVYRLGQAIGSAIETSTRGGHKTRYLHTPMQCFRPLEFPARALKRSTTVSIALREAPDHAKRTLHREESVSSRQDIVTI